MVNVWFAGWEPLVRILVVGTLGYTALVMLLRVSGKRTLAQMNSFDFVITVAIGATFGRVMTARSVPLAEAVTAFTLLITLQYIVTRLQLWSHRFSEAVSASPALLAVGGRALPGALRRSRVTEDELLASVRKHGYGDLAETAAVVMEADGRLTVLVPDRAGDRSALEPVSNPEARDHDA